MKLLLQTAQKNVDSTFSFWSTFLKSVDSHEEKIIKKTHGPRKSSRA